MWLRAPAARAHARLGGGGRVPRASRRLGALAAAAAAGAGGATGATALADDRRCASRRTTNVPLGDKHRVAITTWALNHPRKQSGYDETVKGFKGSFSELCSFLASQGYEGMEMGVSDLKAGGWYPMDMDDEEVMRRAGGALKRAGLSITGTLLHIADGAPLGPSDLTGLDFNRVDFYAQFERVVALEKRFGSEYITLQIDLPDGKKGTGGAYRSDDDYLHLSAQRVHRMQEICFRLGLNFYVETHIDRISEDPEAFCKIFDYCPSYFEVNADISHYLYRNIVRGPHLERIVARVGHNHQRLARRHGDLSSDVGQHFDGDTRIGDCAADWDARGVTWQAMEAMGPILVRGGFSSRVIVGESGPAFAVQDALLLDTKLVPLWRAMARSADGLPLDAAANPFRQKVS